MLFLFFLKRTNSLFYLLPAYYIGVAFYSVVGIFIFDFARNVPFDFFNGLNEDSLYQVVFIYINSSLAFCLGGFHVKKKYNKLGSHNFFQAINNVVSKVTDVKIILLCTFTIFSLHMGSGVEHLYNRYGYGGSDGNPLFRILYSFLLPFSILLIPFIKRKSLQWILLVTVIFFVQGTTSRNLALIPVMFFIGECVFKKKIIYKKLFVFSILSLVFLAFVMDFREHEIQGVFPNIIALIEEGIDFSYLNFALNYAISFSFIAAATSIQDFSFDYMSFYYSVVPFPSFMIDVGYMISNQSINKYAPIPAIAYLGLGGMGFVFFYYYLSGILWFKVGGYLLKKNNILSLFIIVLFLVFMISSLQYNLRGITRLLYYVLFLGGVVKISEKVRLVK